MIKMYSNLRTEIYRYSRLMTHYFIELQSKLKTQLVKLFISYKTRKNTVIIKCNFTYCKASKRQWLQPGYSYTTLVRFK